MGLCPPLSLLVDRIEKYIYVKQCEPKTMMVDHINYLIIKGIIMNDI